jgi:hypothetical protein
MYHFDLVQVRVAASSCCPIGHRLISDMANSDFDMTNSDSDFEFYRCGCPTNGLDSLKRCPHCDIVINSTITCAGISDVNCYRTRNPLCAECGDKERFRWARGQAGAAGPWLREVGQNPPPDPPQVPPQVPEAADPPTITCTA